MTHIATFVNFCGLIVSETRLGTTRDKMLDPLGSVIGEYDDSQNVMGGTEYWPYGEIASETGTLLPSPLKFVGGLGYFRDRIATFLTYIKARWYYPWSTRWTSVDPLWPGESAYEYVEGNPITSMDKYGLQTIRDACKVSYDKCIEKAELGRNSCTKKVTDELANRLKACLKLPVTEREQCEAKELTIWRNKLQNCFDRYQPVFNHCWENYQNCIKERNRQFIRDFIRERSENLLPCPPIGRLPRLLPRIILGFNSVISDFQARGMFS